MKSKQGVAYQGTCRDSIGQTERTIYWVTEIKQHKRTMISYANYSAVAKHAITTRDIDWKSLKCEPKCETKMPSSGHYKLLPKLSTFIFYALVT